MCEDLINNDIGCKKIKVYQDSDEYAPWWPYIAIKHGDCLYLLVPEEKQIVERKDNN